MTVSIGLFVALTLFTTMLALGLSLRLEGLQRWLQRPSLPLRVLLGSCLLVPLLALLLLQTPWSWHISPSFRTAIALMALCPSAPLAVRKARSSGADQQLAALVQLAAAVAAILTVPLLGLLFRRTFGVSGWEVHPLDVALQVGSAQVLPVLLGLGLRQRRPALAERLETPLNRIASGLLLVLAVLVLIKAGPLLLGLVPQNLAGVALMALMAIAALLIGSSLAGEEPGAIGQGDSTAAMGMRQERISAGLVTAMRNPGLALLLAGRHGQDLPGIRPAILLYVLVTVLIRIPWLRALSAAAPPQKR